MGASTSIIGTAHASLVEHANRIESTPFFIFDERIIESNIQAARNVLTDNVHLLYAIKACALPAVLRTISNFVDGFACSSVNELRLGRATLDDGTGGYSVLTTPGLQRRHLPDVEAFCDMVSFNSLGQYQRFAEPLAAKASLGIRVNPQISFVHDERYDPCGRHSRLGVPIKELKNYTANNPVFAHEISGIHFHSNCESTDLAQMAGTVAVLAESIPKLFERVDWINVGGGYLFSESQNVDDWKRVADDLKRQNISIYAEPGASIVRSAGYLVGTVIDKLVTNGKTVCVLDTSVNHLPEVFEYQYQPTVVGSVLGGEYSYILAGCTCLSGDTFGEYHFEQPLDIGSRITIQDVGCYSIVKMHQFNGVELPDIYRISRHGLIETVKRYGYDEFYMLMGGSRGESL